MKKRELKLLAVSTTASYRPWKLESTRNDFHLSNNSFLECLLKSKKFSSTYLCRKLWFSFANWSVFFFRSWFSVNSAFAISHQCLAIFAASLWRSRKELKSLSMDLSLICVPNSSARFSVECSKLTSWLINVVLPRVEGYNPMKYNQVSTSSATDRKCVVFF